MAGYIENVPGQLKRSPLLTVVDRQRIFMKLSLLSKRARNHRKGQKNILIKKEDTMDPAAVKGSTKDLFIERFVVVNVAVKR